MEGHGFMSFDTVVRQICRNRKDPEAKNYVEVASTLSMVLNQLNLHLFPKIKSEIFTVNDNLTVDLPRRVAMVTKVGAVLSNNRVRIFGHDSKLSTYTEDTACSCGSTEASASESCPACTFHGHTFLNGYGELYGYRKPQFLNGMWKMDSGNNRIILGSGTDAVAGANVLVEYKADTSESDDIIQIPADTYALLMYRTFMFMDEFDRPNAANSAARKFKVEYDSWKMLHDDTTLEDYVAAFRGAKMSAIKR